MNELLSRSIGEVVSGIICSYGVVDSTLFVVVGQRDHCIATAMTGKQLDRQVDS